MKYDVKQHLFLLPQTCCVLEVVLKCGVNFRAKLTQKSHAEMVP